MNHDPYANRRCLNVEYVVAHIQYEYKKSVQMVFDMNASHNGTALQPIIHKKGYKVVVVYWILLFFLHSSYFLYSITLKGTKKTTNTINIIRFDDIGTLATITTTTATNTKTNL